MTNQDGSGVACEITIAAVDEGICMLTGFETPDPAGFFGEIRSPGVTLYDLYSLLMPELERQVSGTPSAPGGGGDEAMRRRLNPVKARRFKPVALWTTTRADNNGKASAMLDIPEFTGALGAALIAKQRKEKRQGGT